MHFLAHATSKPADVLTLSCAELMREAGVRPGETALLAGGPPCQAFSVFGKRLGINDARGQMPHQYLRLLVELKPKAFTLENVFGLLNAFASKDEWLSPHQLLLTAARR